MWPLPLIVPTVTPLTHDATQTSCTILHCCSFGYFPIGSTALIDPARAIVCPCVLSRFLPAIQGPQA
ncbi:hypothetical protein PAMC26510_26095 [Caballeronia sordidicola]|uniref:Uncharacterized protein n=1 Tax=Caballeronia sordidicola TaxID=196367 RepID=A0A242MFM4_CABSO|nr:hypothetical protein PAMC26510_26095 [Caballeronia sordidicola]